MTARRSSARSVSPSRRARSAACCCRCRRPFTVHCCAPAAEQLAERLTQIPLHAPAIPVIHNVDVAEHREHECDPPGARAAGGQSRALDRDRARDGRSRRHAHRRVRAGQGADRVDPAHRRRTARICADRQ